MLNFFRKSTILLLIIILIAPNEAFAASKKKRKRVSRVSADSAILINAKTHKQYYAKDIHQWVFPASTTKVMTALLVLEKLSLDQYVTVGRRATVVQPTKLDLRTGDQYKVRDLLYGLLLKSANDAAVVLAEAVAGSEEEFVNMMNARAKKIGAKHTRFANAHGLPSKGQKQYTTAYDMALIFKEALKDKFFRKAISYKFHIVYSKDGRRHFVKSHNKSLFLDWKAKVLGKTGYTLQAKSCFVGYVPKGNETLIIAVFGCRKRWEDIKHIVERFGGVDL